MKVKILACLLTFNFGISAQAYTQSASSEITAFPQEIIAAWQVESNFLDDGKRYRAVLTLDNQSKEALPDSGWTLYFNYLGVIDSESLLDEVEISLINGNFYKLKPTEEFEKIEPGNQFAIPFEAPGSKIKEGDAPSGMYFVFNEDEIAPVPELRIGSFTEERQMHRGPADKLLVPTAEYRYKLNDKLDYLPPEDIGQFIPTPQSTTFQKGAFELKGSLSIGYEEALEKEAQFLAASLTKLLDKKTIVQEGVSADKDIILSLDPSDENKSEAYELNVTPHQIKITGSGVAGVFYGIQSLRALVPPEVYQRPQSSIYIDAQKINDVPRFDYRGLHLDVARNFQSASAVKKLLDVMAFYKLNIFHFHLTDDEGWRLPVETLPELTEVGGRRGHTESENEHMIPSYGSGPDPEAAPGSGWYDRETFIEILQYAKERHIEIVPEIDVPGHARAAIVAMKSRYENYISKGNTEAANRYRLHEPEDESEYRSVQNWDDNVINVCQPSTYRFMETVVDEIMTMYDEAGVRLTTIHMGGDEVPYGVWQKSPACQNLLRDTELDSVDDLQDYFFERLRKMLAERGLNMAGWEEIALDGTDEGTVPDPDFAGQVRPHVWANIWGSGLGEQAYKLTNAGYEVVMSQASNFYFDLSYNKHPKEPGLYWAGFLGSRDPYAFMPFDLYKNAEEDVLGNPISDDAFSNATRLPDEGRKNILGLQGQLWGEKLINQNRMEYMAMPRLFGLAERAWAQQPNWATIENEDERNSQMAEDWNEFVNRLGQSELPRMDYFHGGMHYRIPPPGAVIEDGMLKANTAYPGLTIRYTLDGSKPTVNSKQYREPVSVQGAQIIKLSTFSSTGRGSRTVTIGGQE